MSKRNERGAVSLFVVIFAALLITTITVAFVRLMLQGQQQATMNDLSKSALDSAYAGVEDAKRAIVAYRQHCVIGGNGVGTDECNMLTAALTGESTCDTIQRSGIPGVSGEKEILVKQTEGDEALQQAYTCVKVQLNTPDYVGSLPPNTSRLIPLKSTGPYNQVYVEWYSQDDLQNADSGTGIDLADNTKLPRMADWPKNRPSLLRVQLIQYGGSFNLSDFDKEQNGQMNSATLFLMPSSVGRDTVSFADDVRQSHTSGALQQIRCKQNFSMNSTDGQYACGAFIQLPEPIGGNPANRQAYLRISQIYNPNTTFRVCLQDCDPSNTVMFSAVQPIVDSTGRANDLFRRIQARVELEGSSIPPVEAAVDITGSLCKTFLVTDRPEDFTPGSCVNGSNP